MDPMYAKRDRCGNLPMWAFILNCLIGCGEILIRPPHYPKESGTTRLALTGFVGIFVAIAIGIAVAAVLLGQFLIFLFSPGACEH